MLDPTGTDHHVREPKDVLTRRELEVLDLAATGLTNGQIARQLSLTVHAVKFHLAAIYRKLGVANRTEATAVHIRTSRAVADTAEAG